MAAPSVDDPVEGFAVATSPCWEELICCGMVVLLVRGRHDTSCLRRQELPTIRAGAAVSKRGRMTGCTRLVYVSTQSPRRSSCTALRAVGHVDLRDAVTSPLWIASCPTLPCAKRSFGRPNPSPTKVHKALRTGIAMRCAQLLYSTKSASTRRNSGNVVPVALATILFKTSILLRRCGGPAMLVHSQAMDKRWPSTRAAAPAMRSNGTSAKAPLMPAWSASPPSTSGAVMKSTAQAGTTVVRQFTMLTTHHTASGAASAPR